MCKSEGKGLGGRVGVRGFQSSWEVTKGRGTVATSLARTTTPLPGLVCKTKGHDPTLNPLLSSLRLG